MDANISAMEAALMDSETELHSLGQAITESREKVFDTLKQQLETILANLGMPNAKFSFGLKPSDSFLNNGVDVLSFMFSANKGGVFLPLKKAASGGELSRIMLAVKSILSQYSKLPTIMFDEIDTGVSGEVATKIGKIMSEMSMNMQVFTITHLPQIASRGNNHYKVFKKVTNSESFTQLKRLDQQERIEEIAQMLGGEKILDSALAHAKQLLN
jgi:DNA repair protein RecN (Recombination protein N)